MDVHIPLVLGPTIYHDTNDIVPRIRQEDQGETCLKRSLMYHHYPTCDGSPTTKMLPRLWAPPPVYRFRYPLKIVLMTCWWMTLYEHEPTIAFSKWNSSTMYHLRSHLHHFNGNGYIIHRGIAKVDWLRGIDCIPGGKSRHGQVVWKTFPQECAIKAYSLHISASILFLSFPCKSTSWVYNSYPSIVSRHQKSKFFIHIM